MDQQELSLGQKVRNFRKMAGMSQFDLEQAIDASPGTISRIESGKVNPTKETLLKVVETLNLHERELTNLLGYKSLHPTPEEISSALQEVRDILQSETRLAYILDDWLNLQGASTGFIKLLGIPEEHVQGLMGRSMLEIIVDPQFGVRKFVDEEKFEEVLSVEIPRYQMETNLRSTEVFERLSKLPGFNELWEKCMQTPISKVLSPTSKVAYFNLGGQKLKMMFSREKLKHSPRFEIIEYFNPQPYE